MTGSAFREFGALDPSSLAVCAKRQLRTLVSQ